MNGKVSTKDLILEGIINVNKNINLETLNATENGTYSASDVEIDGWNEVIVNVPSEEVKIEDKEFTENGTYYAPVGVAGYNPVKVKVDPKLEEITINENGTYEPTAGKDGFSSVDVNVEPELQGLYATENGYYEPTEGKDGFSYVNVEVPTDRSVIIPKTIDENGTYNAPTGVDGFNPVIVDVPQSESNIETITITENGTYNAPTGVDGFNPVTVDVPEPVVDELETTITHNGTFNLSENKPYGVDFYDPVIVTVDVPEPVLIPKLITENGVYLASSENADGFATVTVNVPSGGEFTQIADNLNIGGSSYTTVNLDSPAKLNTFYLVSAKDNNQINCSVVKISAYGDEILIPLQNGNIGNAYLNQNTINLYNYGGNYRDIYVTITEIPAEMIVS